MSVVAGIAIVLNLRSRRAAQERERVMALLAERGLGDAEYRVVTRDADLRSEIERAVASGVERLIVGGGDGSMVAAARALAHRECVLGVLPLGTGNSFAQTLSIGDDLERAVEAIALGRVASVDLGIVNDKYFANFATIGLGAKIAEATPKLLKRLAGPLAYVLGGIVPGLRSRPFDAAILRDGESVRLRTQQIVIASGRIFGNRPLLPDAKITDGLLAFFTTTGVSTAELARMFLALALGTHTSLVDAYGFSAREIEIRTDPEQPVNGDGEPLTTTPARFRVDRGALRVFVPPDFVDGTQ
jgi:diacylglycerol kinase (ATP)